MTNRLSWESVAAFAAFSSAAAAGDEPILGYDLYGAGPEKVIVTHDWMGDAANYDSVRPWLNTERFTYVFVDVRGYGSSKTLKGEYNTDEIAADTIRLADHLGWEKFHLVGHSMNAMAGFKTLINDWKGDKRIKSYVAVTPVTPDGYPATDEDRVFLAAAIDDDETARAAFGGLTGGKLNAAWAANKTARNRSTSTKEALRAYYDMWLGEDFSAALNAADIKTPVLVIGGRNDLPGFQESYYADTIANWLGNVAFTYIENAGHYPMQETPILFASLVEGHLASNR